MKKISFLVFHKEYLSFLEKIRNEGVLHIENKAEGQPTEVSIVEKMKLHERLQTAIRVLSLRKVTSLQTSDQLSPLEILSQFEQLPDKTEVLNNRIQSVRKELTLLEPWGYFSWKIIDKIAVAGKKITFFTCNKSNFNKEWIDRFDAIIVQTRGTTIYFITVTEKDVTREIEAEALKLPRAEISELQLKLELLQNELAEIEKKYDELASFSIPLLHAFQNEVFNQFSLEKVILQSERHAEDRLMVLEGWVPKEKEDDLVKMLENEGAYYELRAVDLNDNPPVLLKNNWFSQLFEPIGGLYALPNYHEIDLTPFFAPFYWIFFGFCVGDAGYGLLMSIIGTILSFMVNRKLVPYMKLVSLLGLSTIIMGVVSGTFFGISLYDSNFWFYPKLNLLMKQNGKSINDIMFALALCLGGFQILFGMVMKAANEIHQLGVKHSIATFGWLILIIGLIVCFLMKKYGVDPAIVSTIQTIIFCLSGIMIFLFNSPGKNIFSNVGSGLWGAYGMITGVFGDTLSYIRLFALGVSGGILGYVFNLLSSQLSGKIPVLSFIIMVIILLIGHGINIFMGALGGFVHSMRLTFVEFYKNANFAGGGYAYSPFRKK